MGELRKALDILHKARRIRSPWLPGMLWRRHDGTGFPARLGDDGAQIGLLLSWEPDASDPATVGCLAALTREATGRPDLVAVYDAEDDHWAICVLDHEFGLRDALVGELPNRGATEGGAWESALVSEAEAEQGRAGGP